MGLFEHLPDKGSSGSRVNLKLDQIKKKLLKKVGRHVSGVTKMHSGSPLEPLGPGGTWGSPPVTQPQISSNQKLSLNKTENPVSDSR